MLPRRTIEAYLFFLLRHRALVSLVVAAITVGLALFMSFRMHVFTNFLDLYPRNHPYIQLYQQYRSMFGTANTVLIVVEVKNGTIFDDPETVQKVDRITLALLHDIPGVNGEQVLSITHPKVKTTLTAGSGIKVVPLMYPRVPESKDDLDFLKLKVYSTEGVHGLFVSEDDKATQIIAGFWEEYFDLPTMWVKIQEIVKRESDDNTTIYVTGIPILFAYFMEIMPKMTGVLGASIVMILLILWVEFRSWQGVVIPAFSGLLSAIWGLGFGGLWGLSLDPLVLVIPLLISARAHSHSVQSMERYHEEYRRLGDKNQAIVKSYTEIYAPAMVSLLADGLAILTLLVARIPIIQKLAILCPFWIISIFVLVLMLHPIILCFPHVLLVGDKTLRAALLCPDHPYNVAFGKVNEKFFGASQLIIIAEGKAYCTEGGKPCAGDGCKLCHPEEPGACGTETCEQRQGAIKDAETLNHLDLFGRYMAERPEVGGTVTAATLLKKIFRTFHEADPKWEMLPTRNDHVSQLFFLLTSGTRRGEMDRFFDMNYTNATISVFYRDYTHETIENSITRAKQYIAEHEGDASSVRYRLAGGLIGILAAVNEEVEWSYRVNLILILIVVFLLSYATYVSVIGALIVMLPSLVAQPLSEAVMYLLGIDMNINSLPVAAVGIGIGIDYGYYVLSRIVEELVAGEGFDVAVRRMFETTGKTVLFTGVSLTASIIFWVFFPMKFQAQMALLLVLLLGFHLMGALMFIPPMVSLLKPRFAIKYAEERQRQRAAAAAAVAAEGARASAAAR